MSLILGLIARNQASGFRATAKRHIHQEKADFPLNIRVPHCRSNFLWSTQNSMEATISPGSLETNERNHDSLDASYSLFLSEATLEVFLLAIV